MTEERTRLPVRKTYKLFIGGAFPRSESGRSYEVVHCGERVNVAQGSRKDVRDAVRAARAAQPGWAGKTAYNRGQVVYRIAEVLEGRRHQFIDHDSSEVDATIDRLVWYAGWADKVAQVAGTLNPVAGPFWNVTSPEAVGVVGLVAPEEPPLLGLVSRLAPAIVGGNAIVVLASESSPFAAVDFAEVLATSDVPAGVVNIVTGRKAELVPWLAGHLDVDALDVTGLIATGVPEDLLAEAERLGADNVKRVVTPAGGDESPHLSQSPHDVLAFMEHKTVWHPAGP